MVGGGKRSKNHFFKEVVGSPAGQADIIGAGRAAENNVFTLPFDGKNFFRQMAT